jgi:hypothetical protein
MGLWSVIIAPAILIWWMTSFDVQIRKATIHNSQKILDLTGAGRLLP